MKRALGWAVLTVAGAVLAAEVLGRAAGWGALGAGADDRPRVAVTFDDGPSGRTAALLDVLARHGARATFFVTEPACRAHPDDLRAIRAGGHRVEAHGRWHTHALLLAPWREWAQVRWHPRAAEPGRHLYRPPYGGHSPLTRVFAALNGRQVALWDVEGRDWTAGDAFTLAQQTVARTRPGSVILLHDGPDVTPALLDALLAGLRARGLEAVTVDDLPARRIPLYAGLRRLLASYGG
ncbi:peptidoglycan/xylan/chitin deacetylase (PgdA/CDA1 family) [Deinococcus metalli]|uniref:Peptidoglycan/xylan/chitin deacetylase (PgdA/CDA1 family) n=1 Tax=Deinococcus metalli TaxID=1141878 RepID=A0A7W8KK04_9DEIO|nr:polysaccharide deacetylase family protein [Deinococcus metalli]MBB5377939.1 peptidoglycan/xylan/chitin deacetylase (PgdA/CDA1 family) [Deinococcus metalli]GHF54985.1 polysaccharide deacetylase [Deinococcus metalli]